MNFKNFFVAFFAVCLFVILQSSNVFADECDDIMAKARKLSTQGVAAHNQMNFAEAVRLWEESEKYFQKASEMKNCRCPKIEGNAKKSVEICRKNVEKTRLAMKNQGFVDKYNQGIKKFSEANSLAKNKQWEEAISAFGEAQSVFESIASDETENGKKAKKLAQKAEELANLARQKAQ